MSSNALTVREDAGLMTQDEILSPVMSLQLAKQRLKEFQEFVKEYLVEDEDFGRIPGTPKPTLLKPGADKLCELYGLSDSYEIVDKVEDYSQNPALFDYTIRCTLTRMRTQLPVSSGLGSCNSYEGKYRWREAQRLCPNCHKPAIIKGKEEYGGGWVCFEKKGGCKAKFADDDPAITKQNLGKVENDDIATLKNTILKMAKKRAKVDATLAATRSSGIFTQDVEDFSREEAPTQQSPASSRGRGKQQQQAKPVEQVMCAECRATGGHLPSCKYRQKDAPKQEAPQTTTQPTANAPEPTERESSEVAVKVLTVARKTRKDKKGTVVGEYWQLEVVDQSNEQRAMYCFHSTLGQLLEASATDKLCILKFSINQKGDRTYYQVEDVLEIAGTSYQDGKPVIDAEGVPAEEFFA